MSYEITNNSRAPNVLYDKNLKAHTIPPNGGSKKVPLDDKYAKRLMRETRAGSHLVVTQLDVPVTEELIEPEDDAPGDAGSTEEQRLAALALADSAAAGSVQYTTLLGEARKLLGADYGAGKAPKKVDVIEALRAYAATEDEAE